MWIGDDEEVGDGSCAGSRNAGCLDEPKPEGSFTKSQSQIELRSCDHSDPKRSQRREHQAKNHRAWQQ